MRNYLEGFKRFFQSSSIIVIVILYYLYVLFAIPFLNYFIFVSINHLYEFDLLDYFIISIPFFLTACSIIVSLLFYHYKFYRRLHIFLILALFVTFAAILVIFYQIPEHYVSEHYVLTIFDYVFVINLSPAYIIFLSFQFVSLFYTFLTYFLHKWFTGIDLHEIVNFNLLGDSIALINFLEMISTSSSLLFISLFIANNFLIFLPENVFLYLILLFIVGSFYSIIPLIVSLLRSIGRFISDYDRLFLRVFLDRINKFTRESNSREPLVILIGTNVEPLLMACREILINDERLGYIRSRILIRRSNKLDMYEDFILNTIIVTTEDPGDKLMEIKFHFGRICICPIILTFGSQVYIPVIVLNTVNVFYSEELMLHYLRADHADMIYFIEEKNPKLFRELKQFITERKIKGKVLMGAPHSYELPSIIAEQVDYFDINPFD